MLAQEINSATPSTNFSLSCGQKNIFNQLGYLILENFIPTHVCDSLIQRANILIENFDPEEIKVAFSSKNNSHSHANYFLNSGDKIRFFYEPNAIDSAGNLLKEKQFAINKIGHALHDLDPQFYCFSRLHKIAKLVTELGINDPLLAQSMYICKQPLIGDEVLCHQDSTYLYVEQQPITGLWFALEDATIENGCLWALPGAHHGKLKARMFRSKNKAHTEIYDDTPWAQEHLVPLEVPRGTLIVLHGLLPHMSKMNLSTRSRHAYALHVFSGQHQFSNENWLQRDPNSPFTGF